MTPTEPRVAHRVLLVDDDDAVRAMMNEALERKGFEVVAAANVTEALRRIATESFDVLITDLHMPEPGDGFTVVTAMRHSQPNALTHAGQRLPRRAKCHGRHPSRGGRNHRETIRDWAAHRTRPTKKCSIANLLTGWTRREWARYCSDVLHIVEGWLERAKQSSELNRLPLSDEERTGHLPKLVEDLAVRLSKSSATAKDSDAIFSAAAVAHGKLRYLQGYTPAMLVHESRILQVTIFGTLQSNLNSLDFSLLLPDVMTIADEVDAQLTQSMDSFMKLMQKSMVA